MDFPVEKVEWSHSQMNQAAERGNKHVVSKRDE